MMADGDALPRPGLCCSLRAVFLAAETRPFDVMVLRAAGLAVLLSPVHFFFTAVLAAGLDAALCFAIVSLPFLTRKS